MANLVDRSMMESVFGAENVTVSDSCPVPIFGHYQSIARFEWG